MIDTQALLFLIFVVGTLFGSFFNLISDRVVNGEPILFGRSRCDHCKKPLKSKNLIPFFSFLFQKGKSACCGEKISWVYPLSEALTGLAFVFAASFSGIVREINLINGMAFFYLVSVFSFYIILLLTDAKYRLLPDKIVYTAIVVTIIFIVTLTFLDLRAYYLKLSSDTFGQYLIEAGLWKSHVEIVYRRLLVMFASSFLISLFFLLLILITKGRGMGGGDVKLGFLIGIFNGFPGNVLAIFLGFLLGSVYSLVLIAFKKKGLKDTVAFGPFLIAGSVVAFVWGQQILDWYIGLF